MPAAPTRRHFLSTAVGVAAGGAALALATIPPASAAGALIGFSVAFNLVSLTPVAS
jgi:hypothetical protein